MSLKRLFLTLSCLILAPWLLDRSTAQAELITNGGFEAGLAGWTVTDQAGGSGSWFAAVGTTTPFSSHATVGPASGTMLAVSDQFGPGTHAIEQSFLVPAGSNVILTFDMFVNDWSGVGPIVDPAGLDYTAFPNQHARVDILAAGSLPFDTTGGVLANLFLGVDPGSPPNAYTSYSFDITSIVGGGGTFVVRFAEVDNQGFLNQGVDNVSINATPASGAQPVPEPSSLALCAVLGVAGVAKRIKRRRQLPRTVSE